VNEKENCLFYTCRSVTGTFSVLLIKCLKILEIDNGNRSKFSEKISEIAEQFTSVNLFTKDKVKNIDNSIPIPEYLKLIEKSKYTYILPSYDNDCFSLYRFIEAIDLDCLPLLHPDCKVEDVQKSFNVDLMPFVYRYSL
jgi:hypothetical protein